MGARIYHPKHKQLFQKTKGGTFYCFGPGGDESLGTKDLKEALLFLEQKEALGRLFPGKLAKKQVSELYLLYLRAREKELAKGLIRPRTLEEIRKVWRNHLLKFFGHKTLPWINQRSWQAFCEQSSLNDFSNARASLSHFLNWCESSGLTHYTPRLKNPPHVRRRRKIIPPQHAALMMQFAPESLLLFLSLLYTTGMRRGEAVSLTWDRVSVERKTLVLRESDTKTKEARQVPIVSPVDLLLALRREKQIKEKLRTEFVFPNAKDPKRHMDPGGFKGSWQRLLERTGLEKEGYTWHDFRSTFEKRTHKAVGFTDTERMKIAGSSIEVQRKIYVSMDAEDLRPLAEAVQVPEVINVLESTVKQLSEHKSEKE